MANDLDKVDVSHLEALAKLEAEERAIRALAEKAAWHRDKVAEVYARVVRDYEARVAAIGEQARAVRQRVREDLTALDALHERCRTQLEQARIELQESEFRHEIGEFSREEFQKRQQAGERAITERREEFETVRKLRARYVELLPGEPSAPVPAPKTVPQASVPAGPPPEPPAAAPPEPPAEVARASAPAGPPPQPPGDTVPAGIPAEPVAVADVITPAGTETSFAPPPSKAEFAVPPLPGAEGEQFGTVAVTSAVLIEERSGVPGTAHRLGQVTTIGRTADNQIVVPVREVSRRHAEISLVDGAYAVRDLGSPNGTFVNGERVTERRLQDGDRLAMGGQVFVFKAR